MEADSNKSDCSILNAIRWCQLPSLLHTVAVRIIRQFWQCEDMRALIQTYSEKPVTKYFTSYSTDEPTFNAVQYRIEQLQVPKRIKVDLEKFITPITANLFQWIIYQDTHIFRINESDDKRSRAFRYISYIRWNPRGTINYQLTALNLLNVVELSVTDKYKISCHYCLEKETLLYFPRVNTTNPLFIKNNAAAYRWTHFMAGKKFEDMHFPLEDCNNELRKYFWKHFSDAEKEHYIDRFITYPGDVDNVWYFLLKTDGVELENAMARNSFTILGKLLNDPLWCDSFSLIASFMWNRLAEYESYSLISSLLGLVRRTRNASLLSGYVTILKEFWVKVPKHFVNTLCENTQPGVIVKVLRNVDWETEKSFVDFVFDGLNASKRREVIICDDGIEMCSEFIISDKWNLFLKFLEKVLSEEYDEDSFRQTFLQKRRQFIEDFFTKSNKHDSFREYSKWAFDEN